MKLLHLTSAFRHSSSYGIFVILFAFDNHQVSSIEKLGLPVSARTCKQLTIITSILTRKSCMSRKIKDSSFWELRLLANHNTDLERHTYPERDTPIQRETQPRSAYLELKLLETQTFGDIWVRVLVNCWRLSVDQLENEELLSATVLRGAPHLQCHKPQKPIWISMVVTRETSP